MNTQDWSPFGWTGWISLQSKDSQESSPTSQFKSINSSALSFLYSPTLTSIHNYQKTIALTRRTFFGKVMSLLFNMLSSLVITFLQSLVGELKATWCDQKKEKISRIWTPLQLLAVSEAPFFPCLGLCESPPLGLCFLPCPSHIPFSTL